MTPLNAKYAKACNPQLHWQNYHMTGGHALEIIDSDGETVCTASVNVGPLPSDQIAIKDYSENEGILAWLIENKIVSEPLRHVSSGFVKIPVCKLLVEVK